MLYFYLILFSLTSRIYTLKLAHNEELDEELEQKKDAVYRDMTTTCINKIFDDFIENKSRIMITQVHVKSYPMFEITQELIKNLHEKSFEKEFSFEVTNGSRKIFPSFEVCLKRCKAKKEENREMRYFSKIEKQITHYLIFLDKLNDLDDIMRRLKATKSLVVKATFMLVYGKFTKNASVYDKITQFMYDQHLVKTILIRPESLNKFVIASISLFGKGLSKNRVCGKSYEVLNLGECKDGQLTSELLPWKVKKRALNCEQLVQLMVVPPMVLNSTEGVEIKILHAIAKKLHITYKYTISKDAKSFGDKHNDTNFTNPKCEKCLWDGPIGEIEKDPYIIGVGRVSVTAERALEFAFCDIYYMEDMVWVVPIAKLIPPWASIITIFEWPTWASLFCLIILMGFLTYLYSKLSGTKEYNYLHSFSATIVVSVQLFFVTVVATQPKSNPVRCLFIFYAFFMIIIGSIYQSSLVNVLTNPRYEHQIDNDNEVFQSGIGIGGLKGRKHIFETTQSNRDMQIFFSYEVYDDVNDTEFQWLLTVAKDQDTITILGRHYAEYFIAKKYPGIVDEFYKPKVHLIKHDVLYTEQVSIVCSLTYHLRKTFNKIITSLIESGLIWYWRAEYSRPTRVPDRSNCKEDFNNDLCDPDVEDKPISPPGIVVITLSHLQGAFSVYCLGHAAGLLAFVCELIYATVKRYLDKKKIEKRQVLWKHVVGRRHKVKPANVKVHFDLRNRHYPQPRLRFVQQKTPLI